MRPWLAGSPLRRYNRGIPPGVRAVCQLFATSADRVVQKTLLLALLSFAGTLSAQQTTPASLPGWMAGCWRQVQADRVIDEVWLAPAGGALVGVSRTVDGDSLRTWELMVVRAGPNGLVFEATPSGQPPGAFLASAVSDTAVAFENLTHDFPQLVRYTRRGADSLLATISGVVRDRQRTINFAYARSACPGS